MVLLTEDAHVWELKSLEFHCVRKMETAKVNWGDWLQ